MKYFVTLLCLTLFIQSAKAQKEQQITEGTLELVHPDYGLILRNESGYFIYTAYFSDNNDYFKIDTLLLSPDKFSELKANPKSIAGKDVGRIDFKKLQKKSFVARGGWDESNREEYELFMMNDETFIISEVDYKESKYGWRNECGCQNQSYRIFRFPGGQEIIYFGQRLLIVPARSGHMLFDQLLNKKDELGGSASSANSPYYRRFATNRLKNKKLTLCQLSVDNNALYGTSYKIDILPHKKVGIIGVAGKNVLAAEYDSITAGKFILAYHNSRIDLYNYTFQRMHFNNVRCVQTLGNYPMANILDGNTVKHINIFGRETRLKPWGYITPDPDFSAGLVSIEHKNGHFYLSGSHFDTKELLHTEMFKELCFTNGQTSSGVSLDEPINGFYFKNIDGTPGVCPYAYLIDPDYKLTENEAGMMRVDEVLVPENYSSVLKLKKDNLYTYFPICKNGFRYKKLGDFEHGFARYTLPSGEKGWLDLAGDEYLDE